MKNNRKRLNNKGFTLIELLAVVVILAIVMGITGNAVLNSINNSRKSTLHSAAQTAANTLNTWISEDMLVNNDIARKLGDDFVKVTQIENKDKWVCMSGLKIMDAKPGVGNVANTELRKALSMSETDIVTAGNAPELNEGSYSIGTTTCSAIRYNTSTAGYEVLLVAKTGGKYYVTSSANENYAFSRASGTGVPITD